MIDRLGSRWGASARDLKMRVVRCRTGCLRFADSKSPPIGLDKSATSWYSDCSTKNCAPTHSQVAAIDPALTQACHNPVSLRFHSRISICRPMISLPFLLFSQRHGQHGLRRLVDRWLAPGCTNRSGRKCHQMMGRYRCAFYPWCFDRFEICFR